MKSIIYLHILFFCSIYCTLFGQDTLPVKRTYHIIKTTEPIIVDGVLSESFWNVAESQSDFTQFEPMPFAKTEFKTVVRMSFTDQYIYVGAQLYDDPNKVSAQVTSRDELGETNVDYFTMSLDTYDDDLTGFRFIVTAAGVQADARLGKFETDNGTNLLDFNWDGVWESAVQKSNDGWSVEMKIPLFNLRFPKKTDQNWGLQFARFVKRNGETSSWQAINPNINGIVRQYGNLVGIKDIKNALRLSLHPYISLNYKSAPPNQANKENTHLQVQKGISGGMDIKYGINENFTLDATVIPDFSQVASD
ncbi:MAG: carbohydrate binding family 9 domain-containing protein [Saprospiraceae bacterium]|nr:carbohydrate binding family 9 domain-containing protein [Saprospiraceae bacterium]MBK7796881.1 carbohydrate binding family 9 domain-containing protein [Saprospiraceae bacterium]MBL0259729.1 carbohydrate binding family 9 domain-containing protein [Saprospiraceae bacterium]